MTHNDAEAVAAAINALVVAQITAAKNLPNATTTRDPMQAPPVRVAYSDLVITLERLEPPVVPPANKESE